MSARMKPETSLTGAALYLALAVVAMWLASIAWLMFHTEVSEVTWARWLTMLASLEAVAFAAAGAVFGTTIQRQRVAEAEGRAAKAEGKAEANANDAANGRVLAEAIKARARSQPRGDEAVERGAVRSRSSDDGLEALARRLFPDGVDRSR